MPGKPMSMPHVAMMNTEQRKLMSMPHVAMMNTEQRKALYAFFKQVQIWDTPDTPDSPGSRLSDGFTIQEQQVFDRLYNKSYHYGAPFASDLAGQPSREARDQFCYRFLPNLCGYEPTDDNPNPRPPPALGRLDIEERLTDCQHYDNCWLAGCVRRHHPELGRNHFAHPRPASLDTCESALFPSLAKRRLRNLIKSVMTRRAN